MNATSSIVDDRDPRFTYTGEWVLGGSSSELDSTTHGSNVTGSTAVLTFNGTSLGLYGTIAPTNENGQPVTSYSIDNGTAFTYTAPTTNSTLYQQLFYDTYNLKAGMHTLTVTVKNIHPSEYWLDYAVICTEPATNGDTAKSNSHVGPIVGGVLGGIVVFLLAGLFFLWHRRRLQSRGIEIASVTHKFDIQSDMSSASLPRSIPRSKMSPIVTMAQMERGQGSPPETSSSSPSLNNPTYSGPRLAADSTLLPTGVSPSHPHHHTANVIANPTPADETANDQSSGDQPSSPSPRRKDGQRPAPPPPPPPPVPRLHEDGGVRLEGGRLNDPETMIDVPPVYREY